MAMLFKIRQSNIHQYLENLNALIRQNIFYLAMVFKEEKY